MWFWKSSSISGICTVVDARLQIQRLQRKSDKGAENAARVRSPRSPCPQQTQMFQPDPDVLIFDLGGILMEELIPDPGPLYPGQWQGHGGGKKQTVAWPACRNMKVNVYTMCTGVWVALCVQVGTHSQQKGWASSCLDRQSQICHWSISNAPPPALAQLIASFKAQKTLSFK